MIEKGTYIMNDVFNQDTIREVINMKLEDAKSLGLQLVEQMTAKTMQQKVVKFKAKQGIEKAWSSAEVSRILYANKLGGEGLTTVDGKRRKAGF